MTQDEWDNETDEERRVRFRKTEWTGIWFDGNKNGCEEVEEGYVRLSGNIELAFRSYCEHKDWNYKSVYIKDSQFLGVEH